MKPDFENLLQGNVEFQTRCSFCDGLEEADGDVTLQIGPGDFITVPVGPKCLKVIQKVATVSLDKPLDSVVE